MSIFEHLSKQQREITELFCDIRRSVSSDQRGLALIQFQLAANKLIACMRAEHAVVYPRFADIDGLVTEVAQARTEHAAIEDSINRLRIGGLQGDLWDSELDHLIRLYDQHADLEELSMFPIAGLSMTTKELVKVGVDFVAYLSRSTSVAGASITYQPAPVTTYPRIVRVAPVAPVAAAPMEIESFENVEPTAIDEWDREDTAYVFSRPEAAA
ncbi:MAG: hemerythrin domain-containing protein [Deltaproteobacteria bacterium]|nr:hemerythrin domain-containing protein [Deltaproteobacteria bacterium]